MSGDKKGMNQDNLVSIIMPSYKRENVVVERAVRSLMDQTYSNIEIILIDDNAREDLKVYRNQLEKMVHDLGDNRIVYIQNTKNLGGAGARNEGIKHCVGEYVTFLDDDDEYLPEKVEKQIEYMIKNSLDVCFGKLNIYNEEDKLIDVREHEIESFDTECLRRYHLTRQITGTPTFMVKKQVLIDIGGFDVVPMGQEYYLMHKMLQGNYKFGYYSDCFIKAYRTKAEAISTGKNKISGEKALYKFKKSYFDMLNFNERKYVRCRHYAVMAMAYKRNKKYFKAIWSLFVSVSCSPIIAFKEAFALNRRKKENKNVKHV